MSDIAIRVEGLSKRYRLGTESAVMPTLREAITAKAATIFAGRYRGNRDDSARQRSDFWALRDVSFDVRAGEVLGIIGANGAGKSTLLKILSRIVEPTHGRAEVHGRLGALLEVGTGFHGELTGRENIFLNAAILGMSRAVTRAKFDEIVDFAGIGTFIDTPVKRYSSGMYVRLAFSVAAHIEPEILLIDEVLAVGDAAFQNKCIGKVGEIVKGGRTVLFVSHQLPVVEKLCNRAILVGDGSVTADGPVRDVIGSYLRGIEQWSSQDLAERTSRAGRGAVRLQRIEISAGADLPPMVLVAGRAASFVFYTSGPLAGATCSFTIYDEFGVPVTSFDSANHAAEDGPADPTARRFRCDIADLPLRPGRYRINAALSSGPAVMEDHVTGAASFDVMPGILRGRPVEKTGGYGRTEVSHRWSLF